MTTDPNTQLEVIRCAVARHIANGLVSTIHIRAQAARDLATELDANGANVDGLVEQYLISDGYSATEATTARAAADPDPWAPKPSITEYIPKPVRDVLADRLAHMLLGPAGGALQGEARELTFALKAEGFDLSEPIKQHITDLTLGPDPADVPF
ncbi:hypothetical protein [Streptomyces anulatus]|uniref:hypothetical protein n=1 Tax=Streptomyces anulatus TaxID=1892 RepID=UPI002ED492F0|nr:hypothetical protein OG703_33480 [Streptomyces anulatus]